MLASYKLSSTLDKFLVAGVIAGSVLFGNAAQAITATFNLTTDSAANGTSASFTNNGIGLTVSNASGTSLPGAPINTNTLGLCSYALVGTSHGRCALAEGSDAELTGYILTFDTSVFIDSVFVSQFAGLSDGSFQIINNSTSELVSFSSTGTIAFTGDFVAAANAPITVVTDGTPLAANGGNFRINNLTVTEVPGPLPLLGVGAAFAYSRKLRRKTQSI